MILKVTEAGTGNEVEVSCGEIKAMQPASLKPEHYGFHKVSGGANGLDGPDQYFPYGDNGDGTMIFRLRKPAVTVLHSIGDIREAIDTGKADLHNDGSIIRQRQSILRGLGQETVYATPFGDGAEASGKIVTAETRVDALLAQLESQGSPGKKQPGKHLRDTVPHAHRRHLPANRA